MKENRQALKYFLRLMKEKKIVYKNGELWKYWEPRRNWLSSPKRAEKLCSNKYYILRTFQRKFNKRLYVMAHRVIWSYFYGLIPKGIEINHKDFNKTNNKIKNLELVTRNQNIIWSRDHNRLNPPKEFKNHRCKLSNQDIKNIRKLLKTKKYLQRDIAQKYNVRPNQISRIKTGARRNKVKEGNQH